MVSPGQVVARKVANNWDIVYIAEEFIKGFDDYERFERKHKNLYGVCDDGSKERRRSCSHSLYQLKPEAVNEGMGVINQKCSSEHAAARPLSDLWAIGTPSPLRPGKAWVHAFTLLVGCNSNLEN